MYHNCSLFLLKNFKRRSLKDWPKFVSILKKNLVLAPIRDTIPPVVDFEDQL